MSGDALISVRLPRSLLGIFQAAAERQGHSIHSAARSVIDALPSLTHDDLKTLKEPPREIDNPRISLYVGWRYLDALTATTRNSTLSVSSIFRRILFGLLITRTVQFVQHSDDSNLIFRLTNLKNQSASNGLENQPSCA